MKKLTMALLICGALFAVAICGACARNEPASPPNVVIVTLDTVRPDHLGCYGYSRPTSPKIDAFAKTATRYTRAVSASSWTVPTHASLFTGLFPFEHGAHGFAVQSEDENNVNPLSRDLTTLADVFFDRGYATGGFVANEAFLSQRWQLNQGFEVYHVDGVYGPQLNTNVFRWLDAIHTKPFFLFVNYIDAHRPYNTRPRAGVTAQPVIQDHGELLDSLYNVVMPATEPVPADLAQRVIDQYDTAIANVDQALGELLERLEDLGVLDNTVIVVTADHGEFFGEHFLVEHSKDVYQEVLAVPLLVKAPGQSVARDDETLTTSSDVAKIILTSFPAAEWASERALFADARGTADVIAELYYTRTKDLFNPIWGHRFNRIRTAVFDPPYKLIVSSDGENELYDLANDPGESSNLLAAEPQVAESLAATLESILARRTAATERIEQPPLTEEELKRLKSLGYISGHADD